MGVNSLPKTVTRDCDLNPGPSASESSTLTTRLPGHPTIDRPIYTYQHRLILSNSRLLQIIRDYEMNHNSNVKYNV